MGYEDGRKVLWHAGGMPGYKSLVMLLPEDSLGIVILTNKITCLREELAEVVIGCLEGHAMNWREADENMFGKQVHFSWEGGGGDAAYALYTYIPDLAAYVGKYEDQQYGTAVIEAGHGQAVLSLLPAPKQFTGRLSYLIKDTLKVVFRDGFVPPGQVILETGKDGKPVGFKLDINSSDFLFKYLDFKKQ